MKLCTRCATNKPLTEFNRNSSTTDGRQHYCRECSRAYHREWRTKNPEIADRAEAYRQRIETRARRREEQRTIRKPRLSKTQIIRSIRLSLSCTDCGWTPATDDEARLLHFDHTDPSRKFREGRHGAGQESGAYDRRWPLEQIVTEILDHTEPRCAPCHAKRTATQLRAAWAALAAQSDLARESHV